jgi:L-seryl-tRNA(Ser) seleniumtransferase
MREVGTTNRTHLRDYEVAIGPDTGLLLKAHTSNYVVQGFVASVSGRDLARLAREKGVAFAEDLGSGTLVDLERYGLPHEPTVRETLGAGVDIVTFSGDKLLGGPQAGLIVGRRDLIAAINRNPLKRALRVDKMRLAALEATLRLYLDPDRLVERLPTIRLLARPADEIRALAERLRDPLAAALGDGFDVAIAACRSQIGSGALPMELMPSAALRLQPLARHAGGAVDRLARAFRDLPVPVIGRIADGALLFDLRCLEDEAGFSRQLALLERPAA